MTRAGSSAQSARSSSGKSFCSRKNGDLTVVERGQHALEHGRRFDGGNDLHFSATGFARLDVNLEHALQTLRPGHCRVASCRALSRAHRVTPSASGRGHLLAQMRVGGEYAVVAGEVDARIGDQGRQSGDKIFRATCPE